jgi:hypothetical protein
VRHVCRVLGYARSPYDYQAHPCDETTLTAAIGRLAGPWPTYGDRRITALLRREDIQVNHTHREDIQVNHTHVARLMRMMGLQGQRPAHHPRTTCSQHGSPATRTWCKG